MSKREHEIIRHLRGIQKVVINKCHGGFGLSLDGVKRYLELKGISAWFEPSERFQTIMGDTVWLVAPEKRINLSPSAEEWASMTQAQRQQHNKMYQQQVFNDRDVDRDDPDLVRVIEELGNNANGKFADLKVVEIPADVEWQIEEYDGAEWIAEKHRTWD
jgi:hypothetical protein